MTHADTDFAAMTSRMEREIAPAASRLDEASRRRILARAEAEGWPREQALWIDRIAKQEIFQSVADGVPGPDAVDAAYQAALRRLSALYFESWMEEGHTRLAAFLMLFNLERRLAENRGETYAPYPDAILMTACEGVEQAARRGLSAEEQIETGYEVIRKLSQMPLS